MHTSGNHPDPAQLVAFADGEPVPEVARHVEDCRQCAADARALADTSRALTHTLYRFDCPDALTLGEYALDLLDPERRRLAAAHTLECDLCTSELHSLRDYLAQDPPVRESVFARTRRLIASLIPGASSGLAYGLRGTAETDTLLYALDGGQVSISAGPDEPGHVLGLLIVDDLDSASLQGGSVRLVSGAETIAETTIDDLGNFEFDGVPADVYELEIELPDGVAVVEGLQVY